MPATGNIATKEKSEIGSVLRIENCPFCGAHVAQSDLNCPNSVCGVSLLPRLLVDWEIERLIKRGDLVIEPLLRLKSPEREPQDSQLGPASLDLRLDCLFKEFRSMNQASIDLRRTPREEELYRPIELEVGRSDEKYILHPGEFVLAQSLEYVVFPKYLSGRLDGRSTYGRYGVTIHSTAGGVDAGFRGHLTFELSNDGKVPVELYPTNRVARLTIYLTAPSREPYKGKFQLQVKVKPPIPDSQMPGR
jgi:dCTP deaminase